MSCFYPAFESGTGNGAQISVTPPRTLPQRTVAKGDEQEEVGGRNVEKNTVKVLNKAHFGKY